MAHKTPTERRKARVRRALKAAANGRMRLSVHRSSKHIYAQVIDDSAGRTLASASSLESGVKSTSGSKTDHAKQVGKLLAQRAKDAGVDKVVFDRAGYRYHGRVRALADAAREAGLDF